jgi:predicted O-methyltransferase YrrM
MILANKAKLTVKKIINYKTKKKRLELLEEHFQNGLPSNLRPGLEYLITGKRDDIATLAASEAEKRRAAIAAEGEKKVQIFYSPKPGSAGVELVENMKVSPGKVLEFTMEQIASTGKNEKWGIVLNLLIRGFHCENGIELGACAGVSALYLSSTPFLKKLITVEGSIELSKIAEISLKERPQVVVVNSLFDDAIDQLSSADTLFDFAYIDGHHEKLATIHYFNRLSPYLKEGTLVIFDDISWSYDMREAWDTLSERAEFSHTIDLGGIGICVTKSNNELSTPKKWDLQPITGAYSIGNPHGWKK